MFIRRSLAWANHYYACAVVGEKLISGPRDVSQVWIPPNPGWVCLSVDGGVSLVGMGCISGSIRLKLAWEFGFERLLVHSDSRQAVDLVNSDSADSSVLSLVRVIARLRQKCWSTDVMWVPRDRNCLVDALIKLVDPSVLSLCVYTDPPPEVVLILDMDKACL
ncbi:hypothetical protein V6N12_064122 [Hibiscus sabdariffa]|uniref:RNase H type-1 domain-containing protein n=1 Tax=Hibiscus sabdariffa TaxID=183260 RepID=A0ABR2G4W9_9ROSI